VRRRETWRPAPQIVVEAEREVSGRRRKRVALLKRGDGGGKGKGVATRSRIANEILIEVLCSYRV